MIIKKLISFVRNLKQYELLNRNNSTLELLLESVNPNETLENRIEWIIDFVKWLRAVELFETEPEKVPSQKIITLFAMLDVQPKKKAQVQKLFSSTLQELQSSEFFCEVGLPSNLGLIGELIEKITTKFLPQKPIGNQLSELMITLFPTEADMMWLKHLDENAIKRIPELFIIESKPEHQSFIRLKSDIEDSLIYLISQISAIGLSPGIRKRIPHKKMKALPFYFLPSKLNLYLKTRNVDGSQELNKKLLEELLELLNDTQKSIDDVYQHLDRFGVSTHLVFQLEKMKLFLKRTRFLLELISSPEVQTKRITNLIVELIEQNLHQRNAFGIFSDSATLLAQKIIENNSQTGEHYIAKDRTEYQKMVSSAMGGGVLTAFTVYMKNFIVSLGMSQFYYGAFSTLNYAGSFLLIQLYGFTLATKQPAATASALAHKLESIGDRNGIETITDEIVYLTRTQIAAVFGNLIAVIPTVLIATFVYFYISGDWLITEKTAHYTLHSTDILGPSIFYAIFTGFLLWLSSVMAGWSMNWYSFHQLSYLITHNKKIKFIIGAEGASKLAHFLEHGITGIVGNISLGTLLGLLPELLKFVGLPFEVRHVTLSTGALAASIPTLGLDTLKSPDFIRAALGIGLIGFLNLSVSFALALLVAFRAKKISSHKKFLIYQSVLRRFYKAPFSFFIPKSSTKDGGASKESK